MDIQRFNFLNPWRQGKDWSPPSVPRSVLLDLQSWIDEPEVLVLLGARQVGKTSVALQLVDWLVRARHVPPQDIFFFNLDQTGFGEFLLDESALLHFLKPGSARMQYVFIDEVQRLESPGLLVKGLYDLGLPVKLILTGSSSLDIREKTGEPLTGRKQIFNVRPFSFREYLAACSFSCPEPGSPREEWKPYLPALEHHLDDYVKWGGYPAVVLSSTDDKKLLRLDEIFSSYIEKDIGGFLGVRNTAGFRRLAVLVGAQQGGLVNVHELSSTLRLDRDTVSTYLDHLEKTFVLSRVTPWSTNPRTELGKMPKLYFTDPGLRSLCLGIRPGLGHPDAGRAVEGLVAMALASRLTPGAVLHFWRSKAGAEVDFVAATHKVDLAVEIKASHMTVPRIGRSLSSFISRYHPGKAMLLNLDLWSRVSVADSPVDLLPLSVFLAGQ